MTANVFSLPGPFDVQRIVEYEGPFVAADHLFPDATEQQIAASAAYQQPRFFDRDNHLLVMSFHSLLMRAGGKTILIDTCLGNDKPRPNVELWHQRRGSYLTDLVAAGVAPEAVDIVMCTHLHADHVGWNTRLENGQWVPTFPNATYLFAKTEVDYWEQELEQRDSTTVNHDSWADSVQPVLDAGQAVLVGSEDEIATGVGILPAPGHTPGNVMLRLEQGGERGYVLGDAIHHPIQIDHPEWSSRFCHDPAMSHQTRQQILTRVVDEQAWILPAHFPTPSAMQVHQSSTGFVLSEG